MEPESSGPPYSRGKPPVVAILGLGEAGSAFAGDLLRRSLAVRGWDPAVKSAGGVVAAASPAAAVAGADVILSLNAASVAVEVARSVAPFLGRESLYADLNTGAPDLKRRIAAEVAAAGALFVDVALMAPVPGRGVLTPALASGPGAARFAELFTPLGMPVQVVGAEPGTAAARKLLRSVLMKGLAAAIIEGLRAAQKLGCEAWYREEVGSVLTSADEALAERLIVGSQRHAVRRVHEMRVVSELLLSLGVHPRISLAAAEWLRELAAAAPDPGRPEPGRAGERS